MPPKNDREVVAIIPSDEEEKPGKKSMGKLDLSKLKEALGQGMTMSDAAVYAGSTAKSKSARHKYVKSLLRLHPELSENIIKAIKDKQSIALSYMTPEKMRKEAPHKLALTVKLLQDVLDRRNASANTLGIELIRDATKPLEELGIKDLQIKIQQLTMTVTTAPRR